MGWGGLYVCVMCVAYFLFLILLMFRDKRHNILLLLRSWSDKSSFKTFRGMWSAFCHAGVVLVCCGEVRVHQRCPNGEVTQPFPLLPTPMLILQTITDLYSSLCSCPSLAFNSSIFSATKSRFIFSVYLVDLPVSIPQSFIKKENLEQV